MKKLIIATLLIAGISSFAQDKKETEKRPDRAQMGKLTPEERNQLILKKMTLKLDLNAKQLEQMKQVLAEQSVKSEAMRAEFKENKRKSKEEMLVLKNKMLDEQIAMKSKMKTILTPEQFEKWNVQKEKQHNQLIQHSKHRRDHHLKNDAPKE